MHDLNLFIPITKVDAAQRLVFGVATAEREDRTGEICDYATTKPFYEKWSRAMAAASDGKSLGNLRAMHGPVAAGKIIALSFDDAAKEIEICAKVIDDAEWSKVCEGVYTGFSQGGAYVKRWRDDAGLTRYTAEPSEISLVDLPCLAEATFQMIKTDGETLELGFKTVEALKVGARHSKADQDRIQRAHDELVEAGASCGAPQKAAASTDVDKRVATQTAELAKAFAGLQATLEEILRRVAAIENQPVPLPMSGPARAVSKGDELLALARNNPDAVAKFIETHREALALEAIKAAQRRPQIMGAHR